METKEEKDCYDINISNRSDKTDNIQSVKLTARSECKLMSAELTDMNNCLSMLRTKVKLLDTLSIKVQNPQPSENNIMNGGKLINILNEKKSEPFIKEKEEKKVDTGIDIEKPIIEDIKPIELEEKSVEKIDTIASAAALAISSRSLLLLVDDDPAIIAKKNYLSANDESVASLSTFLFPLLVDLHTFLHQFRATLTFAARRALVARIISSVREFHEAYNPSPAVKVPTIQLSMVKQLNNTVDNGPKKPNTDAGGPVPAPLYPLHDRESHPIIKHMLSHTSKPRTVPLPDSAPKLSLAERRKLDISVNTARVNPSPSTISISTNNGMANQHSITMTQMSSDEANSNPMNCTTLPRIHGMIQPSRFLLINGLFSDDWRLLVPTMSVGTLYTGQVIPPILSDIDVRPLRYQPPELVLGLERNANAAQDVYSLGLVLFEILTGAPLFNNDYDSKMAYETTRSICKQSPFASKKAAEFFIDKYIRARLNELHAEDRKLRDFLYRLLQWQPQARPALFKAASHPFLIS